jgi:hypothetical protein
VWTHVLGESQWNGAADATSFGAGTTLQDVTATRSGFVAVGSMDELVDTKTVLRLVNPSSRDEHPHDMEMEPVTIATYATRPAIFTSRDGVEWTRVLDRIPGIEFANLSGVSVTPDGRGCLAVGHELAEVDATEPTRAVALRSSNGRDWDRVPLDGVVELEHGGVTFIATAGSTMLLATTDVTATTLYRSRDGGRSWRRMRSPARTGANAYVAATRLDGELLLVTVDAVDSVQFWTHARGGWSKAQAPAGLPRTAKVSSLERTEAGVLATGRAHDDALVTTVGR